jgi:hypothetical protein
MSTNSPGTSGTSVLSSVPPVEEIIQLACRAPSVHNTQPWRWRGRNSTVDLFADYTRQLVYADPTRRDLMISCGAALHHLQVAAAGLGWAARVTRFPNPSDERHVATIALKPSGESAPDQGPVHAIGTRRTDRRTPTSWPVPEDRLNRLAAIGSLWGAQVLPVTGDAAKARLRELTRQAARIQQQNPRYIDELAGWTGGSVDAGVPRGNVTGRGGRDSRDPAFARFPAGGLADPVLETEPSQDGMLIVCTSSDDAVSRVRGGEALSAIWLQATQDNLSVLPLSQAVEVEETRRTLQAEVLGDRVCPQILLRVAWLPGARSDLSPTPRRPLDEVLTRE